MDDIVTCIFLLTHVIEKEADGKKLQRETQRETQREIDRERDFERGRR